MLIAAFTVGVIAGCGGGESPGPSPSDPSGSNSAPRAIVSGPSSVSERTEVELDGSGSSDPDSDPIAFEWSVLGSPTIDLALSGASSEVVSVTIGEAVSSESVQLRLVVTDDQGASDDATFTLSIEEIDRGQLPPDPGASGLVGLLGIDSDTDGIRDDVEIAIYERYSASAPKRGASLRVAEAIQSAMSAVESMQDSELSSAVYAVGIESGCLVLSFERPAIALAFVESAIANTDERISAYRELNESQSGKFFRTPDLGRECQP